MLKIFPAKRRDNTPSTRKNVLFDLRFYSNHFLHYSLKMNIFRKCLGHSCMYNRNMIYIAISNAFHIKPPKCEHNINNINNSRLNYTINNQILESRKWKWISKQTHNASQQDSTVFQELTNIGKLLLWAHE